MIAPWPLAFGNARAMGYYAQSERESTFGSIATQLEAPAPWKALIDADYKTELAAHEDRCERVKQEMDDARRLGSTFWTPERRAHQRAKMLRNRNGADHSQKGTHRRNGGQS